MYQSIGVVRNSRIARRASATSGTGSMNPLWRQHAPAHGPIGEPAGHPVQRLAEHAQQPGDGDRDRLAREAGDEQRRTHRPERLAGDAGDGEEARHALGTGDRELEQRCSRRSTSPPPGRRRRRRRRARRGRPRRTPRWPTRSGSVGPRGAADAAVVPRDHADAAVGVEQRGPGVGVGAEAVAEQHGPVRPRRWSRPAAPCRLRWSPRRTAERARLRARGRRSGARHTRTCRAVCPLPMIPKRNRGPCHESTSRALATVGATEHTRGRTEEDTWTARSCWSAPARGSGSDAPTRSAASGSSPVRTSTWRRSTPAWSTPGGAAPAAGRLLVELGGPAGPALRRPRPHLGQERRRRDQVPRGHRHLARAGLAAHARGGRRRRLRRHRAGRRVPVRRRWRDVPARARALGPPAPARVGAPASAARRSTPILPHPTDAVVGDLCALDRRGLPDRRRRLLVGAAQPGHPGGVPARGAAVPRVRPVRAQGRPAPVARRSGCSCRTTAVSTAPTTRVAAGRRSPTACRPTSASRSSCTRTSPTRSSCSRSTGGRALPTGGTRAGLALPRRRRAAGSHWGRGCPTRSSSAVMRDAMCADDHERSGPLLRSAQRLGLGLGRRRRDLARGRRATSPT